MKNSPRRSPRNVFYLVAISITGLMVRQKSLGKAHQIVQNASDRDSAWVYAYRHRQASDRSNAQHWYRRSGQTEYQAELDQERE